MTWLDQCPRCHAPGDGAHLCQRCEKDQERARRARRFVSAVADLFAGQPIHDQGTEPEYPGRCSRCGQAFRPGDGAVGTMHWPYCPASPAPARQLDAFDLDLFPEV
jgi:hypothetical protein